MADGSGSSETSWPTLRKETIYNESKRVMEAQKADIDDIDDKALRTVRITALILAAGVAGIELIGLEEINENMAGFSVTLFLLSLIFGVIVYNESDELVGPKADYLRKMREDEIKASWDDDLLYQLEHWIAENQKTVEFNGQLLITCQIFFISGVGIGVASLLGLSTEETIAGVIILSLLVVLILFILRIGMSDR